LVSSFYKLPDLEPLIADSHYEDAADYMHDFFDMDMENLIKKCDRIKSERDRLSKFYEKCRDKSTGVYLKYSEVFSGISNLELLHRIKCPALIINGKHDLLDLEEMSQEFHSRIPNSNLCEIESGHFATLTHPNELNELVLNFLRGLDAKMN